MSFVYLEEELPEIEIREWVKPEDVYTYERHQKKGINVHTPDELFLQFMRLLNSSKRSEAFTKLLLRTIEDPPFRFPGSLVPELAIQRKDNGDEDVFFEAHAAAMKLGNYNARHAELKKAFFGLETIDEEPPQFHSSAPETVVANEEEYRILPEDYLPAKVLSIKERQGISPFHPNFNKLTLVDKISESTIFTNTTYQLNPEASLEDNIQTILDNKTVVLTKLSDLYEIWKVFMRYDIEIDATRLESILQTLTKQKETAYTFITAVKNYKPKPLNTDEETGVIKFYTIQYEFFQKTAPVLERLKNKLTDLYELYLGKARGDEMFIDNLPHTAYELAQELLENKFSLNDAIHTLKLRTLHSHIDSIRQWLEHWNLDNISVEENYKHILLTQASKYDEPTHEWPHISEYVKEIKKGEVVVKSFEGVDSYVAYEGNDLMIESFDPDEIPFYEEEIYSVDVSGLDEGRKELFEVSLRLLTSLQKASGLPLDVSKLPANVPMQLRKTRHTLIQEQLPELSDELQLLLSKTDYSQVDNVIESVTMKLALKSIYDTFQKDLTVQWMHLLAWWICEIQESVLNRTLKFELWSGDSGCVPSWSPYGPPMEGLKVKKEGVLAYLTCVMLNLISLEGTVWNRYVKLSDTFQTDMLDYFDKDKTEALQGAFKTFDKELPLRKLQEKGEAVKQRLLNTVAAREKTKYLQEYMRFLKNLPSVLIQSSIAKRLYTGCCLQLLSEKFRSDYDWAAYVKDAYKLKKLFATQRLGIQIRPILDRLKPIEPLPTLPTQTNEVPILFEPSQPWTLDEWKIKIQPYMPFADYDAFRKGIQNIVPITEKYLGLYLKFIKSPVLTEFIMKEANLDTLMEFYRKILQVQYTASSPAFREELNLYTDLYKLLGEPVEHIEDVQEMNRKRVLQYFISRQLCFPAKPEFARANTLVLIETTQAGLLEEFITETFEELKLWIDQKRLPTTTNFRDYINKVRETENYSKLKIIDRMTPEERQMYIDAKKLGIAELGEFLEEFEKEEVVEDEFVDYGENNEENDMDDFYDEEY